MDLDKKQITDFQKTVKDYYAQSGRRELAWRQPESDGSFDPYKILVSELMLQQTQVSRVTPKFKEFLQLFPTVELLAESSLAAVLTTWSGLGYNRRAKFLHQAAKTIVDELKGDFPSEVAQLVELPGVGKNTASAIAAYAFNKPVVFVETNIRTVYFYHFFAGREVVSDGEVAQLVGQTLDGSNPREWYWALMDYGSHLKQSGTKLNALSKHYTKQSKFVGSKRQVRGQVIRLLADKDADTTELSRFISDNRLPEVLTELIAENLITKTGPKYHLSD